MGGAQSTFLVADCNYTFSFGLEMLRDQLLAVSRLQHSKTFDTEITTGLIKIPANRQLSFYCLFRRVLQLRRHSELPGCLYPKQVRANCYTSVIEDSARQPKLCIRYCFVKKDSYNTCASRVPGSRVASCL